MAGSKPTVFIFCLYLSADSEPTSPLDAIPSLVLPPSSWPSRRLWLRLWLCTCYTGAVDRQLLISRLTHGSLTPLISYLEVRSWHDFPCRFRSQCIWRVSTRAKGRLHTLQTSFQILSSHMVISDWQTF